MRIVVDLQACQSGSRLGGIGRYSLHLAEALAQLCAAHNRHELRIILNDLMPDSIPEIYQTFASLIPRQQIQVFQVPGPIAENNPDNDARARIAEIIREHYIQRLAPDIIHVASLIEGLSDNVVSSVGALSAKALTERTVITLYDLIPLVDKQRYLQNPLVQTHYYRKLDALKRAGGLLAISEFSRQQGIDLLGVPPDRVINIAAGVDPRFQPLTIPTDQAAQLRQRYGLHGGIVLYTSSFDQRKNQARLIQAFAQLPPPLLNQYQLVIVGNGWEGIYNELYQVATRAGLNRQQVIFTGRIPDDDLLALYNLTEVFIFPSLSEGYGLPVLEAMACGIPTIASNTTSIPEVVGRHDALFDPFDINSIAAKLHQTLTDQGFRHALREHGLIQSRQFTWTASATRALEFFTEQHARTVTLSRSSVLETDKYAFKTLQQCCQTNHITPPERIRIAAALAANTTCLIDCLPAIPRIGWITTWNTRCGIAMYSRYLAGAHIQDYVIFAPYEPQPALPDESNVVRCWHIARDDLRYLTEQIHLHDITTVVIQFNYGLFDFYSLNQFLREMIATGRRVFITLHATTDTLDKQLSQLADPLALCDAIFIHSNKDEAELERIGLSRRAQRFPHGVPDIPIARVNCTIPKGRFVIASYGFFLPHKGLFELIDACQLLIQEYKLDIHLLMINAEYPVEISAALITEAKQLIAKYQLQDRVTLITDFLDDAVSLGWLDHADLICYPYQRTGESSSAAVRMGLAAQRPVAVTPLAIFDDVNDVVLRLPGTSVKEIADGIADLTERLRHPDAALQVTQINASQWVITHRYSTLAEQFWQQLGGKQ